MSPEHIFTVSELVRDAKASLEAMYPFVWVEGELSNVNCHSSGHCYFSLKDAGAQLSGAMFRDEFRRLRFRPANGLHVILQGRLTLYPAQGRFQIVASAMEPKGQGGLQLAFEQLKAKLQSEGLFDADRKKPLPNHPEWIGIVTSFDGAALHDMLHILNRRAAGLRVMVCPVRVQGEGAAGEIAEAIRYLNREHPALEALLVGRGGGSMEDLWAFNEEILARAIAASRIPIISCVGHETDFTIADFVADLRAPTPSAAAELVVRSSEELLDRIGHFAARLRGHIERVIEQYEYRVSSARQSPMLQRPLAYIEEHMETIDFLLERLKQQNTHQVEAWESGVKHLSEKLHLLSPLATLSRGYAIARAADGSVLKEAARVQPNDRIEIQLHQGRLHAQVERTDV